MNTARKKIWRKTNKLNESSESVLRKLCIVFGRMADISDNNNSIIENKDIDFHIKSKLNGRITNFDDIIDHGECDGVYSITGAALTYLHGISIANFNCRLFTDRNLIFMGKYYRLDDAVFYFFF